MQTWLDFLGRLHPLLLHAPIGALVLLALMELWSSRDAGTSLSTRLRRFLTVTIALFAVASAASGWFLAQDYGSAGTTFTRHRNLGIACAALTCITAWLAHRKPRAYRWALASTLVLLLPTGHFGAEMTHGAGFLWAPFRAAPRTAVSTDPNSPTDSPAQPPQSDYERVIVPILSSRCTACHGEDKQKGGLALHTPEGLLQPGDGGFSPVVPGNVEASELMRRLRLAIDHDEHMPPTSKPQPSAQEIALIDAWIANGASFVEATALGVAEQASGEPIANREDPGLSRPTELGADALAAIDALRAEQVHVETIDPVTQGLWIDFRARPATDDAFVTTHLPPLKDAIVELSLARTTVGDEGLALVATLPRLERLDLSGTSCTTRGLDLLAQHESLRVLNVTGLPIDAALIEGLAKAPVLETLFAWDTSLSASDREHLAGKHLELLDLGDEGPSAPLPNEQAPLLPHNLSCPVDGTSLLGGASLLIVHADVVVGVCRTECAAAFWEDPDRYPTD